MGRTLSHSMMKGMSDGILWMLCSFLIKTEENISQYLVLFPFCFKKKRREEFLYAKELNFLFPSVSIESLNNSVLNTL